MQTNLRWKILTILGVVALAGWSVYPPEEKVRLGLDLKGGVHMVLGGRKTNAHHDQCVSALVRI